MPDFLPPSPFDYSGLDLIRDARRKIGSPGRPARPDVLPPSPYDYSGLDLYRDIRKADVRGGARRVAAGGLTRGVRDLFPPIDPLPPSPYDYSMIDLLRDARRRMPAVPRRRRLPPPPPIRRRA